MAAPPKITIEDALVRFLEAQRPRLAPRTYRRYEEICQLLCHCLNGNGYTGLSGLELKRWKRAYEAGDEDAFCHLMGPEQLVDNLGEFLGYFMIRKVAAGQDLLRAAGTVTKSLAKWLHQQGWIDDDALAVAVDRGGDAARDVPKPTSWPVSLATWPSGLPGSTILMPWPTRTGWRITSRSSG